MTIVTIEAIRRNPWHAVDGRLPPHPGRLLLQLVALAADYCRRSEELLAVAAREGGYIPAGWEPTDDSPDIHEESEARSDKADRRFEEICDVIESEFGELTEL